MIHVAVFNCHSCCLPHYNGNKKLTVIHMYAHIVNLNTLGTKITKKLICQTCAHAMFNEIDVFTWPFNIIQKYLHSWLYLFKFKSNYDLNGARERMWRIRLINRWHTDTYKQTIKIELATYSVSSFFYRSFRYFLQKVI
jgi:hypothetical protein